jgi:sugar/nucleoside kinase (ribokinase family)
MLFDVAVRGVLETSREAAGSVSIHAGGSAANFAVAASHVGARVRFVGRVGDDAAGRMLVAELERAGVVPSVVMASGAPTGYVLVLQDVDGRGGNRMLSEAGASRGLEPQSLDPAWFEGLAALHLTGYSFLRTGATAQAATRALQLARQRSPAAVCTMDPGPKHLIHEYGPGRFLGALERLHFDVLLPNLEEGQTLTGLHEPEQVALSLGEVAPVVVVTLGGDGCVVAADGQAEHLPAHPARVVADTTGAGDAFAAAFVCEYVRCGDTCVAASAAARVAAAVVEQVSPRLEGSRPSISVGERGAIPV